MDDMAVIRRTEAQDTGVARVDGPMPFQILTLDGGGAKGLFAARVLAFLEQDLHVSILDHFDLVAGTSAGGIIALGLGAGHRASEIADAFAALIRSVFPARRRRSKYARFSRPAYSSDALRCALDQLLGDKILGDSIRPLVIPSWDVQSNQVHVFKTRHHERFTRDWRIPMTDVALATSAAPTFFPAARLNGQRLIDGGVWANDPSVVAIAEAVGVLNVPLSGIRVLSIGTTTPLKRNPRGLDKGGLLQWAAKAVPLVMDATSSGSQGVARFLVGEDDYVRVDQRVPENAYALDDVNLADIQGLAASVSRSCAPAVKAKFLEHHAPPFKPIPTLDMEERHET